MTALSARKVAPLPLQEQIVLTDSDYSPTGRRSLQQWRERRGAIFAAAAGLIMVGLAARLFTMQVLNRPEFLVIARANRIRAAVIEPTRGGIYDRNMKLLVENRPAYTLYAHPYPISRDRRVIADLARMTSLQPDNIKARIGRYGWNTFQPAVVSRDLPFGIAAAIEAVKLDLPGVATDLEAKRAYPYPEVVHIIGYVGERAEAEGKGVLKQYGLVGKRGIERTYEQWLGGAPGVSYTQVDAVGRALREEMGGETIPAVRGWDVVLNIDADLQRYALELLEDRSGAMVALDPRDGSVLALLSEPDYDPSLFAGVMETEVWNALQTDPGHPLLNRCIQGLYPPGSTYKMVQLAAALEEGAISERFTVSCAGGMQLGRRFFKCWRGEGHGSVDIFQAIEQSCDVFFYRLGLELGVDAMRDYALKFGFGGRTGVDLDAEYVGITPGSEFLNRKYGERGWTRGQAMNIAIGQGDVLATPLQLAGFIGAIATGLVVEPHVVNRIINPATGERIDIEPKSVRLAISERTRAILREGLRRVVNDPRGTAVRQRRANVVMAGKTGTAQNPRGDDHSLFVGFAPFDEPVIAVAVVVEHGGHGSSVAAPLACSIMARHLLGAGSAADSKGVATAAESTGDELAGD